MSVTFVIKNRIMFAQDTVMRFHKSHPVSILHKSIAGRYRPVRVADGPITDRYIFMKNASWAVIQREFVRFNRIRSVEPLTLTQNFIFMGKFG